MATEFRNAVLGYVKSHYGVNIENLDESEIVEFEGIARKTFSDLSDEDAVKNMKWHTFLRNRQAGTMKTLLLLWGSSCFLSVFVLNGAPFFTWSNALGLVLSFIFTITVVAFVIPFFNHLAPGYHTQNTFEKAYFLIKAAVVFYLIESVFNFSLGLVS